MRLVLLTLAAVAAAASIAFAQQPTSNLPAPIQSRIPHGPLATLTPPQGSAGSGLYVAGADRVALTASDGVVAGIGLPRGTYEIIARAIIANDGEHDAAANCRLNAGGAELDYVSITLPPMSRREYMLLGTAEVSGVGALGGRVEMLCAASSVGVPATARWARIHASAIARVTGSVPAGN